MHFPLGPLHGFQVAAVQLGIAGESAHVPYPSDVLESGPNHGSVARVLLRSRSEKSLEILLGLDVIIYVELSIILRHQRLHVNQETIQ